MPRERANAPASKAGKGPLAPAAMATMLCNAIGAGAANQILAPHETVFRQGDTADALFYIAEGKIELRMTSAQGRDVMTAVSGQGDFVGQGCLAGQPLHLATAAAATAAAVIRIETNAMLGILADQPEIARVLMTFLLTRNLEIESSLVGEMFETSERRLADVMSQVSGVAKKRGAPPALAKITFPNHSRSHDVARRAVRFFGYDNVLEVLFRVSESALARLEGGTIHGSAGILNAFDRHRDRIVAVASAVYSRGDRRTYDLESNNF
jgi:CRP/FNR family cyclic AMP-dependent transcriptional regulator